MPQRLIVCCDGTWLGPDVASVSNVRRVYNALMPTDVNGVPQLSHYEPGAGTEGGVLRRLLGAGFAVGLSNDVLDAYQWLSAAYRPGDSVALFGFSRGAYTARSLAGLIAASGLIDIGAYDAPTAGRHLTRAHLHYRAGDSGRRWRKGLRFRFDPDDEAAFPVDFIGVWDTVGARGIPGNLAGIGLLTPARGLRFHDVRLNRHVKHARHALALDEPRRPFTATLWEPAEAHQDVEQRWFPGSHMDVGGGHRRAGLSDGALKWMVEEAEKTVGLRFSQYALSQIRPDPADVLHDDHRGVSGAVPFLAEPVLGTLEQVVWQSRPRAVPPVLPAGNSVQPLPPTQTLDPSVRERQQRQPITGGSYRPTRVLTPGDTATVEIHARDLWNDTGLHLEPGSYTFRAEGQWLAAWTWSDPGGVRGLRRFEPTALPRRIGDVIDQGVRVYRALTGQREATVVGASREVDLPWMYLVGYVANDAERVRGVPGGKGHERIPIGRGTTHEVKRPGYFYAYANDAWGFYGSHRGSVRLTVVRKS
ncbi:hypothetical protein GCM10010358_50290 [Streptomyces minutiscleroticus]|uniref:T6SS Phospholipase effector Tle1-like catalytic domain-containing protein n=1 Tax=Streptomyces minutiscleroticus TaxID=68238 RepID=A0A918NRL9_9ACTN|nr:DUF2235 domain-containing protein [Streptomyces minutiscleroticus]GGX90270.1 hypothetical protein GCM10010358_50290 [Streptomyces minutiscleroticus]